MEILIFLVLMVAIFYFLLIRPQRRRQAEHRSFIESVATGDKVITIGGICGEVVEIDEMHIVLMVEDGSRIKFLRSSIMGAQRSEEIETIEEAEVEETEVEEEEETKEQSE